MTSTNRSGVSCSMDRLFALDEMLDKTAVVVVFVIAWRKYEQETGAVVLNARTDFQTCWSAFRSWKRRIQSRFQFSKFKPTTGNNSCTTGFSFNNSLQIYNVRFSFNSYSNVTLSPTRSTFRSLARWLGCSCCRRCSTGIWGDIWALLN